MRSSRDDWRAAKGPKTASLFDKLALPPLLAAAAQRGPSKELTCFAHQRANTHWCTHTDWCTQAAASNKTPYLAACCFNSYSHDHCFNCFNSWFDLHDCVQIMLGSAADGPASLRCNALFWGVCVPCVVALDLKGFYITLVSHTVTGWEVIPWGKPEKGGVHGQNWTGKPQSSTLIIF